MSLTTIRSRLDIVDRVLASILAGSHRPDRLVLSISREPHLLDEGVAEDALPAAVLALRDAGDLTVNVVPNTGPYRKLFPLASTLPPDSVVVTADDDRLYPPDWLAGLVAAHARSGRSICYRARQIAVKNGRLRPYDKWKMVREWRTPRAGIRPESLQMLTLPIGCCGILYRAGWFDEPALLADLQALAPRHDDLAFRAFLMAKGVEAERIAYPAEEGQKTFPHARRIKSGLYESNANDNAQTFGRLLELLEERGRFRLAEHLAVAQDAAPTG